MAAGCGCRRSSIRATVDAGEFLFSRGKARPVLDVDSFGAGGIVRRPDSGLRSVLEDEYGRRGNFESCTAVPARGDSGLPGVFIEDEAPQSRSGGRQTGGRVS